MQLTSDIILTYPLWERADNELTNEEHLGIFKRLIDVYLIACSIGIKDDKIIESPKEADSSVKKEIGRNTYTSSINTDLKDMLDFMLQNAIIHSKTIDLDIDERLKLAFNPEYSIAKLSPAAFLTGFANYGIEKIFEQIDSTSSLVAISELREFFEKLSEERFEELLKNITLEDLQND